MNNLRKLLFVFTVLVISSVNTYAQEKLSQEVSMLTSIGKEMSNMRKMLETYSFIGLHIIYKGKPDVRLQSQIDEYEKTLEMLDKYGKGNPIITKNIQNSKKFWGPVKSALLTAISNSDNETMRKNAQFVHDNIRSLIKGLEAIQDYIIKKANIKKLDTFNAAVEVGASASRLGAHYMMKIWELDDPTIEKHWNKGVKKYKTAIELLKKSSFMDDPKAKGLIKKCDKYLNYFVQLNNMQKGMPILMHEKYLLVNQYSDELLEIIGKKMSKK